MRKTTDLPLKTTATSDNIGRNKGKSKEVIGMNTTNVQQVITNGTPSVSLGLHLITKGITVDKLLELKLSDIDYSTSKLSMVPIDAQLTRLLAVQLVKNKSKLKEWLFPSKTGDTPMSLANFALAVRRCAKAQGMTLEDLGIPGLKVVGRLKKTLAVDQATLSDIQKFLQAYQQK